MRIVDFVRMSALLIVSVSLQARVVPVTGAVEGTHDPSMARDGRTWYVFATGKAPEGGQFAVRCSEDLKTWRRCGQVFADIPQWIKDKSPKTTELWAPDVQRVGDEYRMYYAYSLFGKNTSGIGLGSDEDAGSGESAIWMGGPRTGAGVESDGQLQCD